jgi:hypothetical protein
MINATFTSLNDTQARLIWSTIEPGVRRAIDNTPGNTIEDIKRMVMTTVARVISITDENKVRFGTIIYMPLGDTAFIVSIEGKDVANIANGKVFDDFMRKSGFKKLSCLAAPVQARLWKRLGYEPIKTLLEKDIWVEQ